MGIEQLTVFKDNGQIEVVNLADAPALAPVGVVGIPNRCYLCGKYGVVVAGVLVDPLLALALIGVKDDLFLDFEPVGGALRDALDPGWLRLHFIGPLKVRSSRQRPEGYISNGCHSCDAIVGSYPLREAVEKIGLARMPEFVIDHAMLPFDLLCEVVANAKLEKS